MISSCNLEQVQLTLVKVHKLHSPELFYSKLHSKSSDYQFTKKVLSENDKGTLVEMTFAI